MKEMVDLYAKLVIATFSFIGPSFTLLISIFFHAIKRSTEKHESQKENLKRAIQTSLSNTGNFDKDLKIGEKIYAAGIKANKRELNLLNPKRQVKRLFRSLLVAIILLGFYYFQHSHFSLFNNQMFISQAIRMGSILASGISFFYSLMVLWQIFCTIIRIKSEEEAVISSKSSSLKSDKSKPLKGKQ